MIDNNKNYKKRLKFIQIYEDFNKENNNKKEVRNVVDILKDIYKKYIK
jgi:hypothetical protein